MNRDLTEQELRGDVGRLFYACIKTTEDMINDGVLSGCSVGRPAIDDERMLPMANKMCGVQADFIYFYAVVGTKENFMKERSILKVFLGSALDIAKDEEFDNSVVIQSNVISSQDKKNGSCCHFMCFLMRRLEVVADA